ncbi:MAG: RsmD family RNA methyltransferase [Promethearchaeota archaeon]
MPVIYQDIELMIPNDKGIYIPADDTYLLIKIIEDFLLSRKSDIEKLGNPVLEVGAGSGLLSIVLSRYFEKVHSTDINVNALNFIKESARDLGIQDGRINLICGSLLKCFRQEISQGNKYFLACFNPPYLPLDEREQDGLKRSLDLHSDGTLFDLALYSRDGGSCLLKAFLQRVKSLLMDGGHVFFIISSFTSATNFDGFLKDLNYEIIKVEAVHFFFEEIRAYHVKKI